MLKINVKRTIPPAAAPLYLQDILNGFRGMVHGKREVDTLAADISCSMGSRFCFMVSSGKAALYLILKALKSLHPHRNEVIIPAFCCYSVPSAIKRAGLKIKLCDVDPDTLDYDYNLLEQLINKGKGAGIAPNNLLAVMAVHLFGNIANVNRVKCLSSDPDVTIIEDAAQVMGHSNGNKKSGTSGDVGFFSLGRGKSISAVEGGVIVTNNIAIAENIFRESKNLKEYCASEKMMLILKAFALWLFQRPSVFWIPKSLPFLRIGETIYDPNFKIFFITSFQAGLLKNWKKKLTRFLDIRRESAIEWTTLKSLNIIARPFVKNGTPYNFVRFPVRVTTPRLWNYLFKVSEKECLGIMHTYPESIDRITALKHEFDGQEYIEARKMSRQLLTLPVHSLLSKRDRLKIQSTLDSIAKAY
jgi:dTDP-4-amino-4,6-dideoxygalactose transaminase